MDFTHLENYMTLLFYLFFILIAKSTAHPLADLDTVISVPLNNDHHLTKELLVKYPDRPVLAKDSLLNRVRRGYYYIDEGDITPVSPLDFNENIQTARRRQDYYASEKNENNKPKKLFVPNLFG